MSAEIPTQLIVEVVRVIEEVEAHCLAVSFLGEPDRFRSVFVHDVGVLLDGVWPGALVVDAADLGVVRVGDRLALARDGILRARPSALVVR